MAVSISVCNKQPKRFEVLAKEDLALRLRKALHEIKQGGNQWRKTLEFMQEKHCWQFSDYNHAMFSKF